MAQETSADHPIPVGRAAQMMGDYIRRLGQIWVEGQVAQLRVRRGVAWITLRDVDAEISIPVTTSMSKLRSRTGDIAEGDRVVALVKPEYWRKQGQLQWRAAAMQSVGIGALLARIAELKQRLAAEGLFAPERKQPLPFLPRRIGLICGRASAARHDVEENSRRRWPGVGFEVREVPVQGPNATTEVTAALIELATIPQVDVIVITRGGGSTEDLLPFSNETLVRAVADCPTPVVSAIGHEEDNPILDLVADLRASTPTDAAKRIVPDITIELAGLQQARARLRSAIGRRLESERDQLRLLTSRPVMAHPAAVLTQQRQRIAEHTQRIRRACRGRLRVGLSDLTALESRRLRASPAALVADQRDLVTDLGRRCPEALRTRLERDREVLAVTMARVTALSPQATLERGYAVVRNQNGELVRDSAVVRTGDELDIRLAAGSLTAAVTSTHKT